MQRSSNIVLTLLIAVNFHSPCDVPQSAHRRWLIWMRFKCLKVFFFSVSLTLSVSSHLYSQVKAHVSRYYPLLCEIMQFHLSARLFEDSFICTSALWFTSQSRRLRRRPSDAAPQIAWNTELYWGLHLRSVPLCSDSWSPQGPPCGLRQTVDWCQSATCYHPSTPLTLSPHTHRVLDFRIKQ